MSEKNFFGIWKEFPGGLTTAYHLSQMTGESLDYCEQFLISQENLRNILYRIIHEPCKLGISTLHHSRELAENFMNKCETIPYPCPRCQEPLTKDSFSLETYYLFPFKWDLKQLYEMIPQQGEFACIPGCNGCCGPVPRSLEERHKLSKEEQAILTKKETERPFEVSCPFIGLASGCRIWTNRPFMCRLYGCVTNLLCPYDKRPLSLLHPDQARKMINVYIAMIDCRLDFNELEPQWPNRKKE